MNPNDPRIPLCEFADIIQVDIRATSAQERVGMMRRSASPKCKMLAEKLETPHEFQQARDMEFVYFQGYFFCRPEIVVGREVPASRLHYIRMLEMVSRREIDIAGTGEDAETGSVDFLPLAAVSQLSDLWIFA